MKPVDYLNELRAALGEYRFQDVGKLTDQIVPTEFTTEQIKNALSMMRRKRLFSEIEKAASLFLFAGQRSPVVRRQWAQALLDQNRIAQGLAALHAMQPEMHDDPDEASEVQGLIGRAFKQLYVNEGGRENLVNASQSYFPFWQQHQGDYRWHGINLAALLNRAQRDGVVVPVSIQPEEIAKKILAEITSLKQFGMWDYGTAMEASLALGRFDDALRWAYKYINHANVDAFELGSTIRQLKEVWSLEGTQIGDKLLPVLEFELLQREGGMLNPSCRKVEDTSGFEAVYGNEAYVRIEWMDTMYNCCQPTARVYDPATGERWGTGFLMKGSDLSEAWSDRYIFVTNAHVVSNEPTDEAPLKVGEAVAEFTRLSLKIRMGDQLFYSPKQELDVSVLDIEAPSNPPSLKPSYDLPALPRESEHPQRIYVIGHPKGGELAVSLYDNSLVAYKDPYIHYRSPTEWGSSGSPVFTHRWQLVAFHHRARNDLGVNEGVLFKPVKDAINRK